MLDDRRVAFRRFAGAHRVVGYLAAHNLRMLLDSVSFVVLRSLERMYLLKVGIEMSFLIS